MDQFPSSSRRLFGLDVLRAVAIVLVLAAHTWPTKALPTSAMACATLGVELFFVLSGYLIGGILLRMARTQRLHTWADLVSFWRRRWYRTLPNYYLFLGLQVAWRTWVGFEDVAVMNWQYFFFLQNIYYGPPFFFPESWSLAIEEWFYLLFAFCLWAMLHVFRSPWKAWLTVVGAFLVLPCAFRVWRTMEMLPWETPGSERAWVWDLHIRTAVSLRLDVVMYGVLGALIAEWRPRLWQGMAKLWPLGLLFIGAAMTSITLDFPFNRGQFVGGLLLLPCADIGAALLLPGFSQVRERTGMAAEGTRWIARLSYSLYLCHGLVLLMLGKFLGPRSPWPLQKHTVAWCLAAWMASFAVAWIVYRCFEKPIMDLRERGDEVRSLPGAGLTR
jgi:peptidoglycan/LPS O-acetylase OafA/YrhL